MNPAQAIAGSDFGEQPTDMPPLKSLSLIEPIGANRQPAGSTEGSRLRLGLCVWSSRSLPPSRIARRRSDRALCARYRKEATRALDDAQLRTLEERLRCLRELIARRYPIRTRNICRIYS
jgi:hypothetical protein